ncbi:MAM and LDL-receptor class A domain-containing protein 1-like [Orbicella faveolata]|uniref:MAM and LDL-receptor class A domain-containing protein 1-like n=1 Tax=Orbicella faveolata TaxID=48498 RepID=UPI0009E2CD2B|nr:MAM and LDL-receptor class A domain-containing protein 1-like [Orbicella faveolata]
MSCKLFPRVMFTISFSSSLGKCNFDLGFCEWANDLVSDNTSPWKLSSFRSSKRSVVKRPDRGGRLGGKFIYAMKSGRQRSKHRLVSAKVCGPKCVELYYFMEKSKKSEFRLLARKGNDGGEDRVWFSSGEESKLGEWTRAVVEINAEDENCFQLVLEANLGGEFTSTIVGMDDVLIANGSCCPMINTPEDTAKANCDFDKGTLCNWRPSTKSTFLWSIGSGQTNSGQASGGMTGPTADFSGSGKYAYIESSEPQATGDKAVLVSNMMAGQQCMRFKYHMHGADIGSLSIYRRGFLVWKEIGNHGNRWLEGQVDFDCSMSQYQVEIEATVAGWRGDIAIDELRFTPGLCPIRPIGDVAAGTIPTPPVPTTALIPMAPPYSICIFNNNLCGWTNALDDDGEWQIHQGDTPSYETGPHYDSDGNGYYLYMEASDLLNSQKIRLESQEFYTPICLHFHYHMYGKDINELRLEQRDLKDNLTKTVWSKTGDQEDYWHFGSQAFYGDHYTVSFVGVRGNSYLGDISLDEVSVSDAEECKNLGPKQGDVGGNPKEGNCNFESKNKVDTGKCKWLDVKDDQFDWTIHSGKTPSSGTGPSSDHTLSRGPQRRSKEGKYIYIESSSPRRPGHEAMLRVKLEGRSFCMQFWYHMYGDPGSLTVMRIVKQEKDDHIPTRKDFKKELHKEWERSEISVDKWLLAEVELAVVRSVRRGTVHWIAIVGSVGRSYRGDIAVDDIEFSEGRCSSRRRS